jgi:hypothetical protein
MPADERSLEQKTQLLLDEAEALIWGLLDENIDAVDSQRLEALLENEEVRHRYIQCVELHSDLTNLLGPETLEIKIPDNNKPDNKKPQSPVLGSLGDAFPNIPGATIVPPRD